MADEDGGTARQTYDELSDAPVVELKVKLVLKLSGVLAAADTGENTRLGADLGREAARELQTVRGQEW